MSKRILIGLLLASVAAFGAVGCEEAYSSLVQYPLRTDPLALSDKFGDERLDPDRPGQLPLMDLKSLDLPNHPLSGKRDKLLRERVVFDPTLIDSKNRAEMKKQLDGWFGTPRNPSVAEAPASLQLDDKTLAKGSSLYRVHCLHCHGVSGDGRGVTARWVNPHPRDFRPGFFKFQSVDQSQSPSPPHRADLRRTLLQGVEGTAMPAFNLLAKDEIEALVSYVIHLSIRGKVEADTMKTFFETNDGKVDVADGDADLVEHMTKLRDVSLKSWEKAQGKLIKAKAYPYKDGDEAEFKASVLRGHALFVGDVSKHPEAKGTNCVSCHKNFGREATYRWDAWGTLVRPNNLVEGIHRGGRRQIDLYNRIHSGINGSGMPPFAQSEAKDARIVWDLVNFVQVLPHAGMREKMGIKID